MDALAIAGRFIVATLLSGLWQAPFFALAAWLVLRVRPRANATTRHSVFAAALLASLILPVITAALTTAHPTSAATIASDAELPNHVLPYNPPKREQRVPTRIAEPGARPTTTLSVPTLSRLRLELPTFVAIAIVGLWLVGATFVLFRLIASLLHLERLKRDALPLPVEYRSQLTRWATASKGSRNVRLCTADEIEVPIAVGLFDAMILVPTRLLDELEPQEIDSIVLHELAHLRRSDDWINAIERFGQALFFFNPAIAWIARQIDLEREVACDDWVLQQNDALPYANCLAKVVESTVWPYRAMTAPGAFVTRRGMSIRIERLLAKHRDVRVSTSFGPAGAAVAFLAVLGIVAAFVSPSIAYSIGPVAPVAPAAPAVPAANPAPLAAPQAAASPQLPPTPPRPARMAPRPRIAAAPVVSRAVIVAEATNPDFIEEMASVGYRNLSVDDLIKLKNLGVTAEFIRGLESDGIAHPSVDELTKMRALGIDHRYVAAMKRRFGPTLDVERIAEMKAVGVSTDYADAMAAAGLKHLDATEIRNLRALDATPEYVRGIARAGFPNLTAGEIQQLKALDIDAETIARANAHGFHNLSIEQLVRLKATGVL